MNDTLRRVRNHDDMKSLFIWTTSKLKNISLNGNLKRIINNKTPPLYLYRDKKEQHEQNR